MHDYELVYILDPDLAEEAVTALMERISTLATNQNAEIKNQERWEKRRLAYEINRKREGTYVVMELRATAAAVHEMDRILKITDGVLRHLIVRADEAIKAKAKGTAVMAESPAQQPAVTAAQVDQPDAVAPGVADAVDPDVTGTTTDDDTADAADAGTGDVTDAATEDTPEGEGVAETANAEG